MGLPAKSMKRMSTPIFGGSAAASGVGAGLAPDSAVDSGAGDAEGSGAVSSSETAAGWAAGAEGMPGDDSPDSGVAGEECSGGTAARSAFAGSGLDGTDAVLPATCVFGSAAPASTASGLPAASAVAGAGGADARSDGLTPGARVKVDASDVSGENEGAAVAGDGSFMMRSQGYAECRRPERRVENRCLRRRPAIRLRPDTDAVLLASWCRGAPSRP